MVEQSSLFQQGAGDVEQPINDGTQCAGVAVTSGSQSLVFGLADGVVPNCDVAPVKGSVSQAPVAGVAARNDAALTTSPRRSEERRVGKECRARWRMCR